MRIPALITPFDEKKENVGPAGLSYTCRFIKRSACLKRGKGLMNLTLKRKIIWASISSGGFPYFRKRLCKRLQLSPHPLTNNTMYKLVVISYIVLQFDVDAISHAVHIRLALY